MIIINYLNHTTWFQTSNQTNVPFMQMMLEGNWKTNFTSDPAKKSSFSSSSGFSSNGFFVALFIKYRLLEDSIPLPPPEESSVVLKFSVELGDFIHDFIKRNSYHKDIYIFFYFKLTAHSSLILIFKDIYKILYCPFVYLLHQEKNETDG